MFSFDKEKGSKKILYDLGGGGMKHFCPFKKYPSPHPPNLQYECSLTVYVRLHLRFVCNCLDGLTMLPVLIINSCIGISYFLPFPWIPSFIPSFRLVNVRGLKGNDRVLLRPLIFQPAPPPQKFTNLLLELANFHVFISIIPPQPPKMSQPRTCMRMIVDHITKYRCVAKNETRIEVLQTSSDL